MKVNFKKAYLFFLCFTVISVIIFQNTIKTYAKEKYLYLGGFTLGFDLIGDGVLVVGLTEVICESGISLPARDAGIKCGDYILSLNGMQTNSAEDIDNILKKCDGKFIVAEVISNGEKCIKNIFPAREVGGCFKLGILVRDYLTGLGTVTFIEKDGTFYSLGHPIVDDKGNMLNINGGMAYECTINGVMRGERGKAGELNGNIIKNKILGKVVKNCSYGLIGMLENKSLYEKREKIMIGEARPGTAQICSTINCNKVEKFNISIVKVDKTDKNNKNLVIKIDDQSLVERAGGIVQGMSGSPIIQNGKIVGAVTHVFLNDSTRGYGICISKMLGA